MEPTDLQRDAVPSASPMRALRWSLNLLSVLLFALRFVHLTADFPNNSPWMDWSKYTDEGWYGDAAIRHFVLGHWYVPGDFNPAVALPVWPLLLGVVFRFTGVSLPAARALTGAIFGVMLLALYALIQRHESSEQRSRRDSLAAPLAVLFLCASPFVFAFDRLAILEPLLLALMALALLAASHLQLWSERDRTRRGVLGALWPQVALGVLLAAMVLTKPTAVALFPAIAILVWRRAGSRVWRMLRLVLFPAVIGALLWLGYYLLLVRPRFLADYRYLFSANAYTGFQLQPLATVLFNTIADGQWIGMVLYLLFFALVSNAILLRPGFFRNPLVPALLVWIGGYFAFLAYHNNLQPRYYLVLAVPITVLVAMALERFRHPVASVHRGAVNAVRVIVVMMCVLAIVIPDVLQEIAFLRRPEYSFEAAAQGIARIVRADATHSPLLLSVSGSDLTLMTGLPSINDDFGTSILDERARTYRPGWFVAWNEIDDDKMDALTPIFRPVRVAAFPALDDPDRNLLILYRLDPATAPGPQRRMKRRTPRPLRTRLGQQPSTTQLQH